MSYFDEDEEELERKPEEEGGDTEVRLSPLALLGIFFGLVLLCGLCFGLGYAVGHHAAGQAVANAQHPAQEAAPDQEPLQGNNSIPKPSAAAQSPQAPQTPPGGDATAPPSDTETNPAPAQPSSAAPAPPAPSPAAPATAQTAAPVRPALPTPPRQAQPVPPETGEYARPALPAAGQYMVQIAAVSHSEDADVLVTALRRHGYVVTARREPRDGLIHVRVGPFASHEEAVRWRNKLLGDGYNAEVQP